MGESYQRDHCHGVKFTDRLTVFFIGKHYAETNICVMVLNGAHLVHGSRMILPGVN